MMNWEQFDCTIVGSAVNGIDGEQQIRKLRPDIVITDIRMPYMDGITMMRDTVEQYNYEAIVISGYEDFDYARNAIALGVSNYLLKPLDIQLLGSTLRKITKKIADKRLLQTISVETSISLYADVHDVLSYTGDNRYILKIISYVKTHYPEKLSVPLFSDMFGVSVTYLNNLIRKELNCTFNTFLNRYRIHKALELLREGRLRIYEIALQTGFSNYKYFIRVFNRYVGYSPTAFLKSF
jgi:two-component system response regulator YesN